MISDILGVQLHKTNKIEVLHIPASPIYSFLYLLKCGIPKIWMWSALVKMFRTIKKSLCLQVEAECMHVCVDFKASYHTL